MMALNKLQTFTKVTINWIKAHVGHEGNERADWLAKQGTSKISYEVEPILPVPLSWIKSKIYNYQLKEWTQRWQGINEARQTKIFFPEPNPKVSKKLLTYDKQTCGKLFRWISGHSFHKYHNHITNPDAFSSPICRLCLSGKEETSHLFAHCEGIAHIRMRILGMTTLPDKFTWTPSTLLAMINDIDKICPEEGTFDPLAHTHDINHEDH
jgi:ribonuclease HI